MGDAPLRSRISGLMPNAAGRPIPLLPALGTAGHEGLLDAFFSMKTFGAAMLAYYVALSIGQERPYWSVITCYIVAQPLTGALLSKGVYRLIGTVVGAGAAIVLVPNLVNAPELLILALALWIGACTYVAALDRTQRSYVSLLAGYSAAIIGFSSVSTPGAIFDVAVTRVLEIGIGIVCVSFVHLLFLPRPVWRLARDRLDAILADAEAWSVDALSIPAEGDGRLWQDRRRLASDLHDLHLLSIHLPYDVAATTIDPAMLRAIEMRLGALLPLASAVEDRIAALRGTGDYGSPLRDLVDDVRHWIACEAPGTGQALIGRARVLEPPADDAGDWSQLVRLSLLDRLARLIAVHAEARMLRDRLICGARDRPAPMLQPNDAARRALHRDHRVAARAAVSVMLTVIVGCVFWIATAWPDGGSAVISAVIICALFSHLDTPAYAAWRVFQGTLGAVVAAAVCAFVLMPRATDFVTLCLVVSPFLLLLGWLLAKPARAPYGVGAVLAFPGLIGLSNAYDSTFGAFANQAVAQIIASLLGCIMLGAVRATGVGGASRRLARAGWRELAQRATMRSEPDTSAWTSRMLDRMALLGPHIGALPQGRAEERDRMRDLRIGMALDDLQRAALTVGDRQLRRAELLRVRLQACFLSACKTGVLEPDPALRRSLALALADAQAMPASASRRSLLLALVGLTRNLSLLP